jgi:hypothetical protein
MSPGCALGPLSLGIVILWVVTKSWILNDILAISLVVFFLTSVSACTYLFPHKKNVTSWPGARVVAQSWHRSYDRCVFDSACPPTSCSDAYPAAHPYTPLTPLSHSPYTPLTPTPPLYPRSGLLLRHILGVLFQQVGNAAALAFAPRHSCRPRLRPPALLPPSPSPPRPSWTTCRVARTILSQELCSCACHVTYSAQSFWRQRHGHCCNAAQRPHQDPRAQSPILQLNSRTDYRHLGTAVVP